ncbi:MAG: hypothetical protein ACHQVK_04145, partial [Candidatus Paceibacterales bacterium]
MKKVAVFLVLFLGTLSHACELSQLAYIKKSNQVLEKTRAIGKGLPDDMAKFLLEKQSDLATLKAGQLDIQKALKTLEPRRLFLFTMNYLDTDPGARFCLEFAQQSNELMA